MDEGAKPHMSRVLHTAPDFRTAVSALTSPEKARLARVARLLHGSTGLSWQDLYQQACADSLDLTRSWPEGVDVVKFLIEAMRSIASNSRRSMAVARRVSAVEPTEKSPANVQGLLTDKGKVFHLHPVPETAEEELIRREDEKATEAWIRARHHELLDLFDDDDDAQLMVLGMLDGLRGKELRAATGLDESQFASKYKKVHRRIESLKGKLS